MIPKDIQRLAKRIWVKLKFGVLFNGSIHFPQRFNLALRLFQVPAWRPGRDPWKCPRRFPAQPRSDGRLGWSFLGRLHTSLGLHHKRLRCCWMIRSALVSARSRFSSPSLCSPNFLHALQQVRFELGGSQTPTPSNRLPLRRESERVIET